MNDRLRSFLRGDPPPRPNPTITLDGGSLGPVRVNVVTFEDGPEGPTVVELTLPRDSSTWVRAWVGSREQVAGWIEHEENAPRTAASVRVGSARRLGWLEWIGVSRPKQKVGGYGRLLLALILKTLDDMGAEEVWLGVGTDRQTARHRTRLRAWYERHGFRYDPLGEGSRVAVRRRPSGA